VSNLRRRPFKTEVVAVRVIPSFKRTLEQLAANEGLDLSAWMRNLILKELKARGIIKDPEFISFPKEGMNAAEKPKTEKQEEDRQQSKDSA
jgi:hypothetical protein